MKAKRPFVNAVAIWICSALFLQTVAQSCGAPDYTDETLFDKVSNVKAIPSKSNFEEWAKEWDKESWVVALTSKGGSLSNTELKKQFLSAFLSVHDLSLESSNFYEARDLLDRHLKLNVIDLPSQRRLASIGNGQSLTGFASLRVENAGYVWNSLYSMSPKSHTNSNDIITRRFAFDVIDVVGNQKNVAWVEPDLPSKAFEYQTPKEFEDSSVKRIFGRIKVDGAYRAAEENGLPARREYRPAVVAVIDSGVDYGHEKLKDQMFVNPNEIASNGVDDDGNGYIDDIVGIDATLPPGDVSSLPGVPPGPADVGGPGANCPSESAPGGELTKGDTCGHGTHVAGLIAAKETGSGPIGVCRNCKLYSLRVTTREQTVIDGRTVDISTRISDAAQIRALAYILNFPRDTSKNLHVHIVNMSLGKYFRSRSIAFLIRSLQSAGVLVVAAAGNERTETPSYPGAFGSVLSVCALSSDPKGENGDVSDDGRAGLGIYAKARFSNFGDWVDICAPGVGILSTYPGKAAGGEPNSKLDTGTSMAAPIVAGAAGYLMTLHESVSANQVQQLLKEYADAQSVYAEPNNDPFNASFDAGGEFYFYLGWGMLNLENSVKALVGKGTPNFLINTRKISDQVKEGCVASSIGENKQVSFWDMFSSMPFLLLQLILGLLLYRKVRILRDMRRRGRRGQGYK